MNLNLAPLMTLLMPVTLLSMVPVLLLSYHEQPKAFYTTLTGLALFIVALLVTVSVEVPLVTQFVTWTPSTLPDNWKTLRDRWEAFHRVRVAATLIGLVFLVSGAIF